jgi:hypothetical protein
VPFYFFSPIIYYKATAIAILNPAVGIVATLNLPCAELQINP